MHKGQTRVFPNDLPYGYFGCKGLKGFGVIAGFERLAWVGVLPSVGLA
jgi:hypothetical protein